MIEEDPRRSNRSLGKCRRSLTRVQRCHRGLQLVVVAVEEASRGSEVRVEVLAVESRAVLYHVRTSYPLTGKGVADHAVVTPLGCGEDEAEVCLIGR